MFLPLALAVLVETPRVGCVAIAPEPLVFSVETARELCPAKSERITFRIGAPNAIDPLAQSEAAPSIVDLDMSLARPGDDPTFAPRVARAQCIVLEGGNWFDWWFALRPYGKQSELCRALVHAHASGTNLIGIGPAGAHLAGRSILSRTTLQRPNRDPHAQSVDVLLGGIGVASDLCVDFSTDGRADPERLLETLFDRDLERAVWIAGPCAWIEDANTHSARVVGTGGAAFVFDAHDSRRSRERILGIAVERLGDGARIELAARGSTSPIEPPDGSKDSSNASATPVPTLVDFFSDRSGKDWISCKNLTLRGERHVLRFAFNAALSGDRSGPGPRAPDRARLDWLPLER